MKIKTKWKTRALHTTITGNVLLAYIGIDATDQNVTIKGNKFYAFLLLGVVSGNTFVGLTQALADVPSGASVQGTAGTYFGLQTIESLCQ